MRQNTEEKLIVVVDDFVSTGNQLINTMMRSSKGVSLAIKLSENKNVVSVTTLYTTQAKERVQTKFPKLRMYGGHDINVDDYTIKKLLPLKRNVKVYRLLEKYAQILRVSNRVDPILGRNEYGLLLGIGNSIPDSTIPIFWARGPENWKPLKR